MVTWRLDSAPFWHTRKYFQLSKLHHKFERSVNFANVSEVVDPGDLTWAAAAKVDDLPLQKAY